MSAGTRPEKGRYSAATQQADLINGFTYCVRYGFSKASDNPRQEGTLTSIYAPIPDEAITASPVYIVPTERFERQFDLENPWRIKGSKSCIATEIQDECENTGQVRYPVYVESDAKVSLGRMARSLSRFVQEVIHLDPEECTFYYSGGRSIHVHVPRFLSSEHDLKTLRRYAEEWNESEAVPVDVGIYSRKRQFRLPGVKHDSTGLRKALVEPSWNRTEIFRAATQADSSSIPSTYDALLETIFSHGFLALLEREGRGDGEAVILTFVSQRDMWILIEERPDYPEGEPGLWRWHAYNSKEFTHMRMRPLETGACLLSRSSGEPTSDPRQIRTKSSSQPSSTEPLAVTGSSPRSSLHMRRFSSPNETTRSTRGMATRSVTVSSSSAVTAAILE